MDPKERGELQDFERRFRSAFFNTLEKIDDLPDDLRSETWQELRERFRQYQRTVTEREGQQPDFDDPTIQDRHAELVKSLHLDAGQIAEKALETQRAKGIADQYKTRDAGTRPDRDREK